MEVVKLEKKIFKKSWTKKSKFQTNLFVLIFTVPFFISFALFTLYPNLLTFYYSLLKWDGISTAKFIGFENWKLMFTDNLIFTSLLNNLIMVLVVPTATVFISVLLADLLVNNTFSENKFYKVLFFFPNVLSSVVIGIIWMFMYDGDFGVINTVLRAIGFNIGTIYWLGEQKFALIAVMIPMIWASVGFYVVIFTNAMTAIPKSIYESAYLDGITSMRRLFSITLPLISGVIKVVAIFCVLGAMKGFDTILVMTNGGPGTSTLNMGLYMFQYGFGLGGSVNQARADLGYASVIGLVLFAILIVLKLLLDKLFPKENIEF
jgi:N-acetylglucosamine transport system permease protein